MAHALAWFSQSGVVQGVIIGATLTFLTAVLIMNAVVRAITTTVNGWSSIPKCGQPGNGILVRAPCARALPIVNVFVRLTFPKGALIADPKKLFNARLDSKTSRAIDVREGETVAAAAFAALIRDAVRLNVSRVRGR